ncbi:MAG TPA: CHC2 zinc finger domain-containing protein [Smithellaceae bacterium]|jgi:DNA primase|nr:CHC2 zinc finger domain-containing protein [Smithellaceae bacterium]
MKSFKPDIMTIMEREGIELRRGKACCPFHEEKNPSFIINQKKQTYHCFGCGAHGDVITLIQKLHGYDFNDACKYLGITPGKPAPVDPTLQRRRTIQKVFETAISKIYYQLCDRSQHLHRLRLEVKRDPSALTEAGTVLFARRMEELAVVDHKLDILLTGTAEDQLSLLKGAKNDCAQTI